MVTREFSVEDVYNVLVNVGGFRHVRTTGDHLILRWDPPDSHENTDARVMTVPAHDSMPATKIFEDNDEFAAGGRWEALVWNVPESDEFPESLKDSFQYLGPADEEILQYDNAHDTRGVGRHHRHYRDEVEGIEFEGLRSHIEKFLAEVKTIHEQEFA